MKRTRLGGLVLMDMMISVALVGAALSFAVALIRITLRTDHGIADAQWMATNADAALSVLRQDVWRSPALRSDGDRELWLETAGSAPIHWSATESGALRREAPGEPPRIWQLGPQITFTVQGPTVDLNAPSDPVAVTLVSQRALLARKGGS